MGIKKSKSLEDLDLAPEDMERVQEALKVITWLNQIHGMKQVEIGFAEKETDDAQVLVIKLDTRDLNKQEQKAFEEYRDGHRH